MKSPNVELHHYRVFLAVAEELHFGRAAERLHMTQPPVTRIIQQLEHELGVALFLRSRRSVEMTAVGEALMGPARDVLVAVENATRTVARAQSGSIGTVRIGYSGAYTRILVAQLAAEVRQQLPGIELQLDTQTLPRPGRDLAQPIMSDVLRGNLDIGLGRWDLIPAGIDTRVLALDRLVIAVERGHRLAESGVVTIAQFRNEPFVCPPQHVGPVLFDRFQRLCYGAGFDPLITQTAPDTWGALSLVGAGMGACVTFSSVATAVGDPKLAFLDISDEMEPVRLSMVWQQGSANPALTPVLEIAGNVLPTPVSIHTNSRTQRSAKSDGSS